MNVLPENSVIISDAWIMQAEGSCDQKPTEKEIEEFILTKGFYCDNIFIFYDNMQSVWRWDCDIVKS